MAVLTKRILSSIVLICLSVAAIFVKWVFVIAVILLIVRGLYEFFRMVENKGFYMYRYFGIIVGASIPLSIYMKFELTKSWELFLIFVALISLILLLFKRREVSGTLISISTTLFGIFYVAWLFSFLIKIRMMPEGAALAGSLILITKSGDIGAYLVGTRWGRTPLISHISPKKSVQGAVGGLFFSVLASFACMGLLNFKTVNIFFIGLFIGVLAQLGDLAESLMKRDCQIKDSGNIFPGMGGVLDLIDSIIFTAPAFYFYISVISKLR